MKSLFTATILLLFSFYNFGQIRVERNFNIEFAEKDSVTSAKIESSLNGFLSEAHQGSYSSYYVDTIHSAKYDFFFSKLSKIGNDPEVFNAPSVLKSYPVDSGSYRLTVAFTGIKEEKPFILQITELLAVPFEDHYRFYCCFEENTTHLQVEKIGDIRFHYSESLDEEKAQEFEKTVQQLSSELEVTMNALDYYAFSDLDELLKAYGFLYSARQCNFLCYDLGFAENEGLTFVTGTNNPNYVFGFLPEFLWYNLPNNDRLYWTFVQGIATYYGGYGLSYDDLPTLKKQFRETYESNPEIDFLEEFKKGRKSSVNRHFSCYVMSAFLYELALEKGTKVSVDLAYSGEEGEDFFKNLEAVLGINEANFHKTILELIQG